MLTAVIMFVLGLGAALSQLCGNVIFLEARKKQLIQDFENWWNKVKYYKKEKIALLLTKKVADLLDSVFGEKIISRKLIWRSTILSIGILLLLLSIFTVTKQQTIGVAPWTVYEDSIQMILKVTDELAARENYATFPVLNVQLANQLKGSTNMAVITYFGTNCILVVKTNGIFQRHDATAFNDSSFGFSVDEAFHVDDGDTNRIGTNVDDAINSQIKDLKKLHATANSYSAFKYKVYYTLAYYVIMFLVTAFSFTASMVFCKIAIREMSRSGGYLSIVSLFFTNGLIVIIASSVLTIFFTFISVPFFWVALPLLKVAAIRSFTLFALSSVLSGVVLLVAIGASTKLMIFTALTPSIFCALVALGSGIAMKWKDAFYKIVKFFLIRLSEKNPFIFVGGILLFVVAVITLLNNLIAIHVSNPHW